MGAFYFASGFQMAVALIMQMMRPTEAWFFILIPAIGCLIGGANLESRKEENR